MAALDLNGLRFSRQGEGSLSKNIRFYKYLLTQFDLLDAPEKPKVRIRLVLDAESGQRLDNFLIRELKGVPKSHIYRIIRDGQIRINGGRSRAATKLSSGDQIRIPPLRVSGSDKAGKNSRDRRFAPNTLYEDKDLLIIDKPSGVAVHGGTGQRISVIQQLRSNSPGYLELVHRIDKGTSGILVLAKNRETLLGMHSRLQGSGSRQRIKKIYQTLLCGRWRGGTRTISEPLETIRRNAGEKRSRVAKTGRVAQSLFSPLELFPAFSLMEVELCTGRLHQIRVHANAQGMPVAGDKVYGDKEQNRDLRKLGLHRQFLHASKLSFSHPRTAKVIHVKSDIPESVMSVLSELRQLAENGFH